MRRAPQDFAAASEELSTRFPGLGVQETDVVSYALYPQVTLDFLKFRQKYGDLILLPTLQFLRPLVVGQEITISWDDSGGCGGGDGDGESDGEVSEFSDLRIRAHWKSNALPVVAG